MIVAAGVLRLPVVGKVYHKAGAYHHQRARTMLKSIEREVSFMASKDVWSAEVLKAGKDIFKAFSGHGK